jgi:hypothetical protein
MNKTILFFYILTLSACNDKTSRSNDLPNFSVSKKTDDTLSVLEQPILDFSQENYYAKALNIFNKGKIKMKNQLPISFKNITERVGQDLENYDKAKKLSHTNNQYVSKVEEIQVETGVFLIDEEVRVNEIYNETLEELSNLNDEYYNYFIDNNDDILFEDYYKVSRIRIAEEVIEKLDELVHDEKEREKSEANATKLNVGLTLVSLIPGATACTKILEGLTKGAKIAKRGGDLATNSSKLSKLTYSVFRNNKNAANKIAKSLNNAKKRKMVADKIAKVGGVAVISDFSTEMYYSFKSKDKGVIEERIKDGADWVLAVHFQQIRDLITENKTRIHQFQIQKGDAKNIE